MELLIGVIIGLFIQSIIRAGWRMLNPPSPLPQPVTPAQRANERAYDAAESVTPRVRRMKIQRRVPRGPARHKMEDVKTFFDH